MLLKFKAHDNHSYHIERNYDTFRNYERLNCYRVANTNTLLSNCYVRLSIATHDVGGGGGELSHPSQWQLWGY